MTQLYKNKYRSASARAQWWDYTRDAAYFVTICTQDRAPVFGEVRNGEMHLSDIGHIAQACWDSIPEHFAFVTSGAFVVMPNHVHGILILDHNGTDRRVINDVGDGMGMVGDGTHVGTLHVGTLNAGTLHVGTLHATSLPQPSPPQPPVRATSLPTTAIPSTSMTKTSAPSPTIPTTSGPANNTNAAPTPANVSEPTVPPKNERMAAISPKPGALSTIIRSYKSAVTKRVRPNHPGFGWQTRFHDHIIRNRGAYEQIEQYIIANPSKWDSDKLNQPTS